MAMRPTTPQFRAHAGPSSPPATPTIATNPKFNTKNKRNGVYNFPRHMPHISTYQRSEIVPNTDSEHSFSFSYNPYQALDLELSPHSSSSSVSSAEIDSPSPPSRSTSPDSPKHMHSPQPRSTRVVKEGNFTIEEINEEDFNAFHENDSVIRPSQYEDAVSSRAGSPKQEKDIDPQILHGMNHLHCSQSENDEEDALSEREAWLLKVQEAKRRRRRSSVFSKRSHAQSIGSDTDDEDIQPVFEGINEAGSSARRLRRKVADRGSLIFDDPPPRIDELEEPNSDEEIWVPDDIGLGLRDLPYFMEVDSDED